MEYVVVNRHSVRHKYRSILPIHCSYPSCLVVEVHIISVEQYAGVLSVGIAAVTNKVAVSVEKQR